MRTSTANGRLGFLLRLADVCEAIPKALGRAGAWLVLPLIGIIIFDVVTRKVETLQFAIQDSPLLAVLSSTKLQEMEWHLHTALFLLALGFAYTVNGHVRVDFIRETLSERKQAWIEFLGLLVFTVPYVLFIGYFAAIFVAQAYSSGEASASMTGLSHRWIIKSFVLLGLVLVLLAALATLIRHAVYLFGPVELRGGVRMNTLASAAAEHVPQPPADAR